MDPFGFDESAAVWQDAPSSTTPAISPPIGASTSTATPFFISPPSPVDRVRPPVVLNDGFDDFDDFNPAPDITQAADDDFGDFGDFDEAPPASNMASFHAADDDAFGFGDGDDEESAFHPPRPAEWMPIRLSPMPDPMELSQQIRELLGSTIRSADVDSMLSGEGIRQMDSSTQLLVTPERSESHQPSPSLTRSLSK